MWRQHEHSHVDHGQHDYSDRMYERSNGDASRGAALEVPHLFWLRCLNRVTISDCGDGRQSEEEQVPVGAELHDRPDISRHPLLRGRQVGSERTCHVDWSKWCIV